MEKTQRKKKERKIIRNTLIGGVIGSVLIFAPLLSPDPYVNSSSVKKYLDARVTLSNLQLERIDIGSLERDKVYSVFPYRTVEIKSAILELADYARNIQKEINEMRENNADVKAYQIYHNIIKSLDFVSMMSGLGVILASGILGVRAKEKLSSS